MNACRSFAWPLVLLALGLVPPTAAATPDSSGRIAGLRADATYYLAVDVETGIVLGRHLDLQYLLGPNDPQGLTADAIIGLTVEQLGTRLKIEQLLKEGKIVVVPHGTRVTMLDANQTIRYPLLTNQTSADAPMMERPLTRVRIEAGPVKGRELYALTLTPLDRIAVGDAAWIVATHTNIAIGATSLEAAHNFWKELAAQSHQSTAVVEPEGHIEFVPQGTACTVIAIDDTDRFVQVRALDRGTWIEVWVPVTAVTREPPIAMP